MVRGHRGLVRIAGIAGVAMSVVGTAAATTTKVNGALSFTSDDKQFSAKIGGRLQQDWAFIQVDDDARDNFGLGSTDGTEFRRARLYASGKMHGNVKYKSEYEFANGSLDAKDLYIELTGVPGVGNVRVGNFYEPISLVEQTSSKYITFVERALPTGFVPSRNMGLMVHRTFADGAARLAAGVFREDGDDVTTSVEGGALAQSARITALPMRTDDGRTLVHLGVGVSHRRPPGNARSYSFRAENHIGEKVIKTGTIAVDELWLVDAEAAIVAGSFSVQGEYVTISHTGLESESARAAGDTNDPSFSGFYAQASFFPTGEHRPYSTSEGVFSRVKPKTTYGRDGGSGAIELAARYSYVDLNDTSNGVEGGTLSDVTFATNWYLNAQAKVMADYTIGSIDRGDAGEGTVSTFTTRFQIDF